MREEQREFEDHLLWPDSVLESTYGKAYADMVRTEKKRRRMKKIPVLNIQPQSAPHMALRINMNPLAAFKLGWQLFKMWCFNQTYVQLDFFNADGEGYCLNIHIDKTPAAYAYYTDWEVEKELMARANSDNIAKETQKVLEELSDFESKFNE